MSIETQGKVDLYDIIKKDKSRSQDLKQIQQINSTLGHLFNRHCCHLYWQEYRVNSIMSFTLCLVIRSVLMQIQLFNGKNFIKQVFKL